MSLNNSANSRKNKCSSEPVQSQKRFKTENTLKTNLWETEQKLLIVNEDVEDTTLTRSMRKQKPSPVKVINAPNTEKGTLKFGVQFPESKITLLSCTKTFISENIVKNLDELFFPEEREEQNISDPAKLSSDSNLTRKDIQDTNETIADTCADSIEENNDQVQKKSKPNEYFENNKSINISLNENKKEDSNKEKNASNYEEDITFDSKKNDYGCETNDKNNLKDIPEMRICEDNATVENYYKSEYKDNLKEQFKNKSLLATEKQDNGDNKHNEKICRDTEENIQPQVLEIISIQANEDPLFKHNTTLILNELYNDINVIDVFNIPLSRNKNLQSNMADEEFGNFNNFKEQKLHLTKNDRSGNVKEKLNVESALKYDKTIENKIDREQLSTRIEIENDKKHDLDEILYEDNEQDEKPKIPLVNNLEAHDNSEKKLLSLHEMESKSEEIVLQIKSFNLYGSSAKKNAQINVEPDQEAYLKEMNIILREDKSEAKQLSRQNNGTITNSVMISSEKSKRENEKDFDFSYTENEANETKKKKLTLFYTSALDYSKDFQTKDEVDHIRNDNKEISDLNKNECFKNSVNDLSEIHLPISKQVSKKDFPNNPFQKSVNYSNNVNDQEKNEILKEGNSFSENSKISEDNDNSEIKEDNISHLHDLDDAELEKNRKKGDNNAHDNNKYELNYEIATHNWSDNIQQSAKSPYNDDKMQLVESTINNCNYISKEISTENNGLEEKCIEDDNDHFKSNRHELEKRSFLITATDYFKTEKGKEIFKETEKYKAENGSKIDENLAIIKENEERDSYSDHDDSFAMDDDFALTASQLSKIETDERNHFTESKGEKVDSIQQTENCMNTHFNQDSVTAEIIDQLFYIRESVELIKETLSTLLKSKDTAT